MASNWTTAAALAHRLRRNHLAEPSRAGPATVTGEVCAFHAQAPLAAELGLAVRSARLGRGAFQALVDDGVLVRTYAMRGTAHLLAARDLGLYLAAVRRATPVEVVGTGRRLLDAAPEALDGGPLTRAGLAARLTALTGVTEVDEALTEFTVLAAHAGVLAFGPPQDGKETFVRVTPDPVDEDAALHEVVRRYVRNYGPVAPRDLSRWLGVTIPAAHDLLRAQDVVDVLNGSCVLAEDADTRPRPVTGAWLLPRYDAWVLGSGQREAVVPDEVKPLLRRQVPGRANPGRGEGAAGVQVVLVDGVVHGTWRGTLTHRTLTVELDLLTTLAHAHRDALDRAARRLAAHHGAELRLSAG
ncbi:crosslink repair DNA glycosylase YcaQ family protein [Actinosynnema sp. NPDC050436]|uniref:DNA glycosylase AlkZ-like family protein n=1 Tax=Actinosynnema sp. NPDC050436 TaxID=3155659 RepID=UPI0033CC4DB6